MGQTPVSVERDDVPLERVHFLLKMYGLPVLLLTVIGVLAGWLYSFSRPQFFYSNWVLTGNYLFNAEPPKIQTAWRTIFTDAEIVNEFSSAWFEVLSSTRKDSPELSKSLDSFILEICSHSQTVCNTAEPNSFRYALSRYLLQFGTERQFNSQVLPLTLEMPSINSYKISASTKHSGLATVVADATNQALIRALSLFKTKMQIEKREKFEDLRQQIEDLGYSWAKKFEGVLSEYETQKTALQLKFASINAELAKEMLKHGIQPSGVQSALQYNPAVQQVSSSEVLFDFHQSINEEIFLGNLEKLKKISPSGNDLLNKFLAYRQERASFDSKFFAVTQTFQGTKGVLGDIFALTLRPIAIDSIPPIPVYLGIDKLSLSVIDQPISKGYFSGMLIGGSICFAAGLLISGIFEILRMLRRPLQRSLER